MFYILYFYRFFLLALTTHLSAVESYKVKDLGTLGVFDFSDAIDINQKGDVLFEGTQINPGEYLTSSHIKTASGEVINIDAPYAPFFRVNSSLHAVTNTNPLLIWSPSGLQKIQVNDEDYPAARIADLNESNHVLINEYECGHSIKNYLWGNGALCELPIIKSLRKTGLNPINIEVKSINEKGEIVGTFFYGTYHKRKPNKWICLGQKAFFWDGTIHVIDLKEVYADKLKINNNSQVMISTYCPFVSFLWNKSNGLQLFEDLEFLGFNNSGIIICRDKNNQFLIWEKGALKRISDLTGIPQIRIEALEELDTWQIIDIKSINDRGEIIGNGYISGEQHAFLLEAHAVT